MKQNVRNLDILRANPMSNNGAMTYSTSMSTSDPEPASAPPGRGRARRGLGTVLRVVSFLAMAALGSLVGGFGLFATHVSEMRTPAGQSPADAIVVLTGGQARLDTAMELLKTGKGKRLLVSGVHPAAGADQLRRAMGGDRATFNCCVDIDRAALDTIGNAEESAKWVKQHGYKSVIVVTNNYHMPRSLLEMGRLIGDVELQPYPVVNRDLHGGKWLAEPDALRVLITEYAKYLAALSRSAVPDAIFPTRLASSPLPASPVRIASAAQ